MSCGTIISKHAALPEFKKTADLLTELRRESVTIAVVLFTFTTACAQIEFTVAQFAKLINDKTSTKNTCRWIMIALIFVGGIVGIGALIAYVDFFAGLYTLVNLLGVYWCTNQIVALTKEYFDDPQKWETTMWKPWADMKARFGKK